MVVGVVGVGEVVGVVGVGEDDIEEIVVLRWWLQINTLCCYPRD